MSDEKEPLRVYKLVLSFLDYDELGDTGVKDLIEYTRYPNHIIAPKVMSMESVEVQYNDNHPLNNTKTHRAEFEQLFKPRSAQTLVKCTFYDDSGLVGVWDMAQAPEESEFMLIKEQNYRVTNRQWEIGEDEICCRITLLRL